MTEIIETHRLRREYGTLVAVDAADLRVESGQVVGLIGPNGAGKTTLLRMLATLLRPTDGDVRIAGYDARTEFLQIRRHLGFMPDFFNLYSDLTLRETLGFFADAYGVERHTIPKRIDETLHTVDLHAKGHELVRNLSRGMTQRLGLGTLLVRDPRVLLLDEPASGLDPLARMQLRDILRKLRNEGRTVVVSSHILPELEGFCTDMIVMDRGQIMASGSVEDIARKLKSGRTFVIGVKGSAEAAKAILEQSTELLVEAKADTELLVEVAESEFDESELVQILVQAGVRITKFCEQRHGIEDIFMMISGQNSQRTGTSREEGVL